MLCAWSIRRCAPQAYPRQLCPRAPRSKAAGKARLVDIDTVQERFAGDAPVEHAYKAFIGGGPVKGVLPVLAYHHPDVGVREIQAEARQLFANILVTGLPSFKQLKQVFFPMLLFHPVKLHGCLLLFGKKLVERAPDQTVAVPVARGALILLADP
jgi:hypothetical protein